MATSWGVYEDILNDYLATREHVSLNTKPHFCLFHEVLERSTRTLQLCQDQTDEDDASPFGELDSSFLIANHRGIFYVSSNMSITKFEQYFAIGSGASFGLGTMYALYDLNYNAEQIARKAVEAAITFNVYCGGSIDLFRIES